MYTQTHVRPFLKSLISIFMGLTASIALLFSLAAAPTAAKPLTQNVTNTITVTLWYAYAPASSEEQALSRIILDANHDFPNVIIQRERIAFEDIFHLYEEAVRRSQGPDLLLAPNDSLGDQVRSGLVKDLTSDLEGRLTNVYTTAIDGMKVDGKMYGVPESAKAVALYYDITSIPTPPTTTVQLLDLVKSGKKIAINTGRDGAYYNFGFFGAFGGQLLDSSGKAIADQGGFIPAMEYLVELKNAGAIINSSYQDSGKLFEQGKVDMLIDGPWRLVDYRRERGNFSIAVLPSGPSGLAKPLNGIDGFYVNPHTKNFSTTLELALFMTNQASSQQFTTVAGHVPIRSDVSTGNDTEAETFAQASAQGLPRPQLAEFSNYWDIFGEMFTDVLSGTVSPQVGVQRANRSLNTANGITTTLQIYLPIIVH